MKKIFAVYILLSIFCSSVAQSQTLQNIYGRQTLSLNGRWNYVVDPYETGYYDYRRKPFDQSPAGTGGFFEDKQQQIKTDLIEYNFDLSPTMNVPGDWNSQSDKLQFYEGTIWFRKKFTVDIKSDSKYFLYFGAANYMADVYLNGKKLGTHKGGFTPFQFDATANVKTGENVVIVKVDNTRHADEIPTVNTDWWNYGGLTRDVMLSEVPQHYIADYKIQLAKSKPNLVEGYVQLSGTGSNRSVSIRIPELGAAATVQTNDSGWAKINLPVKNLQYWSPEAPKLYTVEIAHGAEKLTDRIGFRTIETRGQDILLNGRSVFLRGICLHDENPLIPGRLRGAGDMRMMLQWAKELNCNYVRLAHYPHSEEMVRLADEMGLMVWAEVPVYWTISWENKETYANAQQQLNDLISRDKNRSSVIIWSVGNETPISEVRNTFMGNLVSAARNADNTRLVAAALEVHRKENNIVIEDPLGDKLDLISFNEYAGWYFSNTTEMLNYKFDVKFNKPVVITEFGADALGGFHGDSATRWSEEYQALLYRNQFKMLSNIEGLRGMTPWILTDFRSPRRLHPYYQDYWNRKGLLSETGKKKLAFFELKAYYDMMEKKYND